MVYRDMKPVPSFTSASDSNLLREAHRLAHDERQATAALIACLAEVDTRRLYLGEGCGSLFAWCTDVLHLSRDAAYARIEAARVARRFPILLELLASGSVTMSVVALLGPHLSDANHQQLLAGAHHKSKRDIEHVVAALAPKPDVPSTIRKLPAPVVLRAGHGDATLFLPDAVDAAVSRPDDGKTQVSPPAVRPQVPAADARPASVQRAVIAPLAPERYKIQFTVGRTTHDKLRRAQDLLRHAVPNGDPAEIFDRALTLLVAQLEKQKWAAAGRPGARRQCTSSGRSIPTTVRRAVSRRDEERCTFVGAHGRCAETGGLEFHHVVSFAYGGAATEENIQLRCRAHNQYEARRDFPPVLREDSIHDGAPRLENAWLIRCV